jgi:hypothetical protein
MAIILYGSIKNDMKISTIDQQMDEQEKATLK